MPQDSKGNYHPNAQMMRAAERVSGKSPMDKGGMGAKADAPGESEGGDKTHTITEKADGSMHSRMHDGTETEHPDHMHMLAHVGHHVTGGDKHHIAHHDGMSHKSHGIHESGEHEETQDHGDDVEGLKQHVGEFFGSDGEDGQQDEEAGEQAEAPKMGGY